MRGKSINFLFRRMSKKSRLAISILPLFITRSAYAAGGALDVTLGPGGAIPIVITGLVSGITAFNTLVDGVINTIQPAVYAASGIAIVALGVIAFGSRQDPETLKKVRNGFIAVFAGLLIVSSAISIKNFVICVFLPLLPTKYWTMIGGPLNCVPPAV